MRVWDAGNPRFRVEGTGNLPRDYWVSCRVYGLGYDFIGREFQLKNSDAMKFTTQHDLY